MRVKADDMERERQNERDGAREYETQIERHGIRDAE